MKWIEIKSGNDLPTKDGAYITIDKDNEVAKFWFSNDYPIKWEWLRGNTRTGNLVGDNSHIKKWLDEYQPSGGKSEEEILQDFGCPEIPFDENVTMYYPAILSAMKEHTSQYAHQQPVQGYICQCCKKDYTYDLIVPDEVWDKISPKKVDGYKGGGLLCPECILEKILPNQQPVNDGWVRVEDALPDYRLVVDVYKSHHNVVEPAARLSTDITGEKWSCEYGYYITHWRLRPEPPKQTV